MSNTKRLLTLIFILVLLITFVSFISEKANAVADEKIYWGEKLNIEPNKEWKIKFNMDVNPYFVNSNYFYILDESGTQHPTKAYLDIVNPEVVSIVPTINYNNGKTYSLFVKSGVKSLDGKAINKSVMMDFKIKEDKIQATIEQEKGPNGTATVKLTISLKDNQNTPLSGYKPSDFTVRIKQLSDWIYSFADYGPFSKFLEKEKGVYTVNFKSSHNKVFDFINFKAKEDIISEHLLVEIPKNIAELTNFPTGYTIKEIPSVIEGITNPDDGKKFIAGFIQIEYYNYEYGYYGLCLDSSGNWVSTDVWLPVIDTSINNNLSTFTLPLSQKQLNAIYSTKNAGEYYIRGFNINFKGLYENQQIINTIKFFTID